MKKLYLFFYASTFFNIVNATEHPIPLRFSTEPITMDTVVQQALKHRPDLEALEYATRAYKSAAKVDARGYFPTITLQSNFTQETGQGDPVNTTILQVEQLIYSFAGPQQKYRRSKKYAQLSELEKFVLTNRIRLETEKSFFQAFLLQKQLAYIIALKASSKRSFDQSKTQNTVGLLDKTEWLKNVEAYGNATTNIDQYSDSLQTALKKLEFLTGNSLSFINNSTVKQLSWRYKKNPTVQPLSTYYEQALTNRPELKQGLKRIAIERANVRLAQGARLPIISMRAAAGHTPKGDISVQTNVEAVRSSARKGYHSMHLHISWPLFDGTVSQHQEAVAEANRIKEILVRDQIILDIKQEVQDRYYSFCKALKQLNAQKLHYLRSQNEFAFHAEELKNDLISAVEFDSAQTSWKTAQLDWLAQNVAAAVAERELMFACGYPSEI